MRKADLTVELLETRHVRNGSRCCRSAKTVWHHPADAAGLGPSGRLQHPGCGRLAHIKSWQFDPTGGRQWGDRWQHALGERRKTRQCNCDLVLRLLREIAVHVNAGVTRGLGTGSNGARTRAAQAAPATARARESRPVSSPPGGVNIVHLDRQSGTRCSGSRLRSRR
jgi:hypothetical protein